MQNFIDRFSEVVRLHPEKTALVCDEKRMSYKELDILSARIASRLIRRSVGKGKICPIVLERGFHYIAALIGVLRAGAGYAPLTTGYPKKRIDYIVQDCGADFVIDNAFLENIGTEKILFEFPVIAMEDVAVAIYTSGSTGNPKGILHDHRSFTNAVTCPLVLGVEENDIHMCVASFSFAISAYDVLSQLWMGAELHILTEEQRKDILFIDRYIDEHQITSSFMNPQLLKQLPIRKSSMKRIATGGERVSGIYSPYAQIINVYGLSELLSIAVTFDIDKLYDNTPIGRPLPGYKALLLDEDGNRVPDGEDGELCIAGPMALGYINLPEVSARAFTANPYSEDENDRRIFHTNDICRRLPDGSILYVDRKDWMVKINGQRVEIGEVEVQMGKVRDIKTAVIRSFVDDNGQTYLCGYYTSDRDIPDAEIRMLLSKKLPSYMIPRFLVHLDAFPLNPSGKLDRKALQEPSAEDFRSEYAAPVTEEEKKVCAAFEKILKVERVGINDDFLSLGGDSIKVVMLQEELRSYNFSYEQILMLRTPGRIAGSMGGEEEIAFTYEDKASYPMTDPQLGIYLEHVKNPGSLEYNNPVSLFFPAALNMDAERLRESVCRTVELYPFMKVSADVVDGVPSVLPRKDMPVDVLLETTEETDPQILCKAFTRPFEFETGPLFRFKICLTPEGLLLLCDVHHLIMDGTSLSLFMRNLAEIYMGEEPDYEEVNGFMLSAYEEKAKKSPRYEECRAYFDQMLTGLEIDSNLIPDRIGEPPAADCGEYKINVRDHLDISRISDICREMKITENSLFLGAFSYALAVQSGQDQSLFCIVENGRHLPELKNTFGMLVHTLPICITKDENESVADYLPEVQKRLFDALGHDLVSIVQLAGEYEVNSDILFAYQGEMLNGVDFGGTRISLNKHRPVDSMSKLSVDILKRSDDYSIVFEYRADLYLPETIEGFARLYLNILEGMLSCSVLGEIDLVGEEEKAFYRRVNDNQVEFDRSLTMVDLFRRSVSLFPDKPAVVFKEKVLTYSELDRYSERLAGLLARHGVTREVPVGIMVNRSERFALCSVAVLKAGGACQPLDSHYPPDRLLFMLSDSGAPVVIADDELAPVLDGYTGVILSTNEIHDLPEDEDTELTPPRADSLFALIYTSGSTGKPKGCMLEHRNLVNYCLSYLGKFGITEEDRFAAYNAFGFDVAMSDLYPALTAGATVYVVPEETRLDLPGLHDFAIGNRITIMDCTMQLGRQYVTAYPKSPYIRFFTVGGEKLVPCPPPEYRFLNAYGPTECTIGVTYFEIDRLYDSVPIGQSFGNCDIYIVDSRRRLLPPGAVGELVISGYPVVRGYLNRPELTEEKFIPNSCFAREGYEKMYLTGDICRYLPDGNLQFVGRRDEQVKIRGFRIELTEIERRIREYEGINDATVVTRELPGGGKAVVAYVVSDTKVDVSKLNLFVAETLPEYMIPSVTMQIDSIPVNPNGKVDRRKLPEPTLHSHAEKEETPRELNSLEQLLCTMVSEITGFENNSVTDSLISMGLTSLTTIMFSARLYERYGIRVSVSRLMDEGCTLLTVENMILEQLLSQRETPTGPEEEVNTENVPLCAEQLGVYFDSIKRPEAVIYNIPMKYTFSGRVDVKRLKEALEKLIPANPVLTSRIVQQGKDIVQQQIEDFVCDIPILNLDESRVEEEGASFVRPFNLARGPLFRAEIIRTKQDVTLLFDVHHIIMDGLSLSSFIRQLAEVYDGKRTPAVDTSYYAYIAEEEELLKSEKGEQAKAYYQELFADYENASDISGDLNRNAEEGELHEALAYVPAGEVEHFCKHNSVTPAALFLAATQYAVSRCTGDRQVYMSMISGSREDVRYIDSIGMFVKNLPLHAVIDTERTALEFVRDTSAAMHRAQENSAYPFIRLFDQYGFVSEINYACQLGVDETVKLEGEAIEESVIVNPLPKFKLSIHIEEAGEKGIAVNVRYNSALFSERLAGIISGCIAESVRSILSDGSQPLCRVSMLTAADREKAEAFRSIEKQDIPVKILHHMFEAQVKKQPEKTALIACDRTLTYAELDAEANKVANALVERGVQRGDRITILLKRTSRQFIAIYGILKTGAAYIPCDPDYPDDRISYIIENSGARYVLSDQNRGFSNELDIDRLLENQNRTNPHVEVDPEDLAYLIYTSGSTGRPKGVAVRHRNIANAMTPVEQNRHIYALSQGEHVFVSVTTVSFDMSLKETFGSLSNGQTLVLASEEETRDSALLSDLFERTHGDCFNATPSRYEQYMLLERFRKVLGSCRILMFGGEKSSSKFLEKLKAVTKARIFNTYGPTETTVSCNVKELTEADSITAGRPLLNVNEYIVDCDGNLLPTGIMGELYVGGDGVSKGYLNNTEMTERSFREYRGERIYRTGDYARWTDEGDVVILGRMDNQVKLRGLRIELGEVERAILSCEGVRSAVAMIRPVNGVDNLCAYYAAPPEYDEDSVRKHIAKRLTDYMVPTALMRLDSMPQTPNGKTDYRALPQPTVIRKTAYVEPVTEEEKKLCAIYAEVLSLERVGAESSFFDLGGTSLSATGVLVKANDQGLKVSYTDIFALKTPRALAMKLRRQTSVAYEIGDYDYSALDEIIGRNEIVRKPELPNRIGNVLLTGASGFLGIHILKEYLDNYSGHIYCLLRDSDITGAEARLKALLFYYFGSFTEYFFENRITVVKGTITSTDWFDALRDKQIDTVINCAALVKHFSESNDIEEVNVGGVRNLIRFCKDHDSMLVQVSTQSVAGDRIDDYPPRSVELTEQKLFIGQWIDNQYVYSKFLAERYVLEAVREGLRAKIMRVGNLAARVKDGEFQINYLTNGFVGRLRAYVVIGAYPYSMMNYPVEMAPIDETAEAILKLCGTPDPNVIFHPFNNHYVPLGDIIMEMREIGIDIRLTEDDEFAAMLFKAREDPLKSEYLTTLLAYQNADETRAVEMIRTNNEFTTQVLYRLGFKWSMTSRDYMDNFLHALEGLDFFNVEV